MQAPSKEQLKERSKHLREIMLEKYGVKISHGHSLEIISKLFGFKDWNTASAASKPNQNKNGLPFTARSVGEMKRALAPFKDSDIIDAMYEFKLKDFLNAMDGNATAEDIVSQEFSFSLEQVDDSNVAPTIVSFKLILENEDLITPF